MFSLDGKLYRFSIIIYKYFALNVLFLIFCVPLVTIPAATGALFTVAKKYAHSDDLAIFVMFWRGFRENWKQSTILGAIFLFIVFIIWSDYNIIFKLHGSLGSLIDIGLISLLLIALSTFLHVFPLMVYMNLTTKQLIINGIRLGLVKPYLTLTSIGLLVCLVYLTKLLPFLFFTLLFSITSTLIYRLMEKKFAFVVSFHDLKEQD